MAPGIVFRFFMESNIKYLSRYKAKLNYIFKFKNKNFTLTGLNVIGDSIKFFVYNLRQAIYTWLKINC